MIADQETLQRKFDMLLVCLHFVILMSKFVSRCEGV